jgi:arsenite methyltransferase
MLNRRLALNSTPGSRIIGLVLLAALLAGCVTLKQCAYEGNDRDTWQQPGRVIQSLRILPGEIVADLGSGSGYFIRRLAAAVGPLGKIYAVDIDEAMNRALKERLKEEGIRNVKVILARPDDPLLPPQGVDLIFTSNAYHHLESRVSYFANLRKYLSPDGRVAIIDFDRRSRLAGLWGHDTPKEVIISELQQAGYRLKEDFDYLDRQSFLVFVPKPDAARSSRAPRFGLDSKAIGLAR